MLPSTRPSEVSVLLSDHAAQILVGGAVLEMEVGTPEEVRGEAAKQNDDEFRQARPNLIGAGQQGSLPDRLARSQGEGEAGTHDAGKGGDGDPLGEVELLDGLRFWDASISRSLLSPASAANAIPTRQAKTPIRVIWPGRLEAIWRIVSSQGIEGRKSLAMGGSRVPKAAQYPGRPPYRATSRDNAW